MNGARVLVTGTTGMIGTHVLSVLPPAGRVVAVSRAPRERGGGRARWRICDLTQPGAATDLVASVRPDIVIHLAGAVRGDRSHEAVGPTLHANLVATVELLEAATRASCHRIVLSGSQLEEPAVAAAEAPGLEGSTIDIGSGALTSVRRIVELIECQGQVPGGRCSARCRSARRSSWWRRMSMRPPACSDGGRRPDGPPPNGRSGIAEASPAARGSVTDVPDSGVVLVTAMG